MTILDSEPVVRRELEQRLAAGINLLDAERLGVSLQAMRASVAGAPAPDTLAAQIATAFARPAIPYGVTLGDVESRVWHRRLALAERELSRAASAVARVWLDGHPALRWAGTCWFATDRIAVTTRAIAQECRHPGVTARIHKDGRSFAVTEIRTTDEPPFGPLLAFLIVDGHRLADPWRWSGRSLDDLAPIAAIGYFARDSRAGDVFTDAIYAGAFNQKCVAPGRLLARAAGALLTHDCATVGNSAGALLVGLATGEPAGVHLGGALETRAAGVAWDDVARSVKAAVGGPIVVAAPGVDEADLEARRARPEDYADRQGYRRDFLGIDVPAPTAGSQIRNDVAGFTVRGERTTLLPYTHFSVCMSTARRMCLFTACNVEGGDLKDLGRAGIPWRFDPRLDDERQAGDDLYRNNDLDRGHMVRRLDPVWGDDEEADAANEDTFHFTNSCPQHKDLNQKTWNDLEDYVLLNAGKHRLRLNVFTGPVFRDDDPEYRDFQVPADFWKVVVMVKDDGTLSATAYTLSQRDLVTGLEFVFGEFRTYQIPLRQVEEWTGLDFGELRSFDPKEGLETAARATRIDGPGDIVL